MTNRILVIGLDGFEKTVADRLICEGRMPNLTRLLQTSACVELDHGSARRSGLAWEHFSTGLAPAGAGRWSAVTFDPNLYECIQQPTRLTPFPDALDCRTVVFDVPYFDLHRAPDVRGLVSWGAHDPGTPHTCNPGSLSEEVSVRFGDYPATPWIYGFTWNCPERTRIMGEKLVQATHLRARMAQWLLGDRLQGWDLGIVVVSELHSAIEALWHGLDPSHPLHDLPSGQPAREGLEAVYEAVDDLIGSLVDQFPDCAHVLISMHGMGANNADVGAMALLPELLYRRAFGHAILRDLPGDPIQELCKEPGMTWSDHVRQRWTAGQIMKANASKAS